MKPRPRPALIEGRHFLLQRKLIMKIWSHALLAVFCTLAGMGARPAQAASPASWAPRDAILLIEVPNCPHLVEQYKKTMVHAAMGDEQIKGMYQPIFDALEEGLNDYAAKLGLTSIKDLQVEPTGGLALIVTADPPSSAGAEPDFHLAVAGEWGESAGKLNEALARITATAVQRGGKKESAEFRGVQITSVDLIEPPAPAEGEDPGAAGMNPMMGMGMDMEQMITDGIKEAGLPDHLSYARHENTFVMGSDAAVVKEVLRRVQGDGESLDKNDDYLAIQRHCAPIGQLNFFLNIPRLVELARDSAPTEQDRRKLQSTGLDGFRAMVSTLALKPKNNAEYEMRCFLPVQGEPRGLVRIFTQLGINKPVQPDRLIPDSSLACGWMNFQLDKLLDEVQEIAKVVDPQAAEQFKANMMVPTADGQIINLADVFNSFSMPARGYMAMTAPYQRENVSLVLSLAHKNRDQIGKIFNFIGQFLQKRDFMGESIHDVAIMPIGVSVALTDRALILGNTPGVEQAVRSGASTESTGTLASDRQFQRTASLAPQEAWMVFYVDSMRQFNATLALRDKMKAAGTEDAPPAFSMDVTDQVLDSLKQAAKELEGGEQMRKYQGSTLFTITNTPKGIQMYMNGLGPQQE